MTTSLIVVAIVLASLNILMWRRGYSLPGAFVVRCSKVHSFTTNWVEGTGLHAIKLGQRSRKQHFSIGKHWAVVPLVKDEVLTEEDRLALTNEMKG